MFETARETLRNGLTRKRAEYMNARRYQHHRALTKIGLILPGELPPT